MYKVTEYDAYACNLKLGDKMTTFGHWKWQFNCNIFIDSNLLYEFIAYVCILWKMHSYMSGSFAVGDP